MKIKFSEFQASMDQIYLYFNTKIPPITIYKLWYSDIKDIQKSSWDFLIGRLKQQPTLPKNIPLWFNVNAESLVGATPSAQESLRTWCEKCKGQGVLFEKRQMKILGKERTFNVIVAKCDFCENWKMLPQDEGAFPAGI